MVELAPGAVIDGRYVLHELLGEGGMGTVYAAERLELQTKIAIKFIEARSTEMAARFDGEARAVGRLRAPSIVQMLDSGTTDRWHYLVYEYVDGPSLAAVLRARGRLTEQEALAVATAIARALALAHKAAIIHRDVKPSNILLRRSGDGTPDFANAKLSDFGVSGVLKHQTAGSGNWTGTGQVFGTPLYMSPEQLAGKPQSAAADVYGLGTVLFEMLYGRRPFDGESFQDLFFSIITAPLRLPEEPTVDERIKALLRQCLEKDSSARPADGSAVLSILEHLGAAARAPPAEAETWTSPVVATDLRGSPYSQPEDSGSFATSACSGNRGPGDKARTRGIASFGPRMFILGARLGREPAREATRGRLTASAPRASRARLDDRRVHTGVFGILCTSARENTLAQASRACDRLRRRERPGGHLAARLDRETPAPPAE